jgi:hypothetical protein
MLMAHPFPEVTLSPVYDTRMFVYVNIFSVNIAIVIKSFL